MAANQLRLPAEESHLGQAGIDLASFQALVEAISEIVRNRSTAPRLEARVGGWAITKNKGWVGTYKN